MRHPHVKRSDECTFWNAVVFICWDICIFRTADALPSNYREKSWVTFFTSCSILFAVKSMRASFARLLTNFVISQYKAKWFPKVLIKTIWACRTIKRTAILYICSIYLNESYIHITSLSTFEKPDFYFVQTQS